MEETLKDKQIKIPDLCKGEYVIQDDHPNIAVVGDLHLHSSTPQSRIDDYADTCCKKLSILRKEMLEYKCKYLICPGDIFHVYRERTDFEYNVIQEFLKFKYDGIRVFIINGNHDISNDRIDTIDKSSLGILYLTNVVEPFTDIKFGDKIEVTGVPFPTEIPPVKDVSKFNICVCHKFYDMLSDKDTLKKEDVKDLGYNVYVMGHDHVVYDLERVYNSYIVRPGSFMRGTAHNYNTDRMVYTQNQSEA